MKSDAQINLCFRVGGNLIRAHPIAQLLAIELSTPTDKLNDKREVMTLLFPDEAIVVTGSGLADLRSLMLKGAIPDDASAPGKNGWKYAVTSVKRRYYRD